MSTQSPSTQPNVEPEAAPAVEEFDDWDEEAEREFDELLTSLYFSGHDDREYWL